MPTTSMTPTAMTPEFEFNLTDQEIDRLIRARYPIIAITSHEEDRVMRKLVQIGQSHPDAKAVFSWTTTQGFQKVDAEGLTEGKGDVSDILMDLPKVVERKDNDGKAIYVFRDVHEYLRVDPLVRRRVRDLARMLVKGRKTIVFLSPVMDVPTELEKEIAIVDYPLPDQVELGRIVTEASKRSRVPVKLDDPSTHALLVQAMQGLTDNEARMVLRQAMIAAREFSEQAIPYILHAKKQIILKSGVCEFIEAAVTMRDIGGLDLLKAYIIQRQGAFSEAARNYGLDTPRGIVMAGVPGAGKSLLAKVAGGGRLPIIRLDFGSLFGSLLGESENKLRRALKTAEACAPAIFWWDEVEKGLGGGGGRELDGGTATRMLGSLLTWMQEQQAGVYVVATANDISGLRPELLRRFDDIFFVDLPTPKERSAIFDIHLRKRRQNPALFDIGELVRTTRGFTGAEIEKVIIKAMVAAFHDGQRPLAFEDLVNAIKLVVPVSVTMQEPIGNLRMWARSRALLASSPDPEEGASLDGFGEVEEWES